MEKKTNPNCEYVDPETGAGCEMVGKDDIHYPHDGSNYCIHHLPLPLDEKASISKIPIGQLKEQLAGIAAFQIKKNGKVQMRGVHFVCDPLTIIPKAEIVSADFDHSVIFAVVRGARSRKDYGDISFRHSKFHGVVKLSETSVFCGNVSFSSAEFSDYFSLTSNLDGNFNAADAIFGGNVVVAPGKCNPTKHADFSGAHFIGYADFSDEFSFRSNRFKGAEFFQDTHITTKNARAWVALNRILLHQHLIVSMAGGTVEIELRPTRGHSVDHAPRKNTELGINKPQIMPGYPEPEITLRGKFKRIDIRGEEIGPVTCDEITAKKLQISSPKITAPIQGELSNIGYLSFRDCVTNNKVLFGAGQFKRINIEKSIFFDDVLFIDAQVQKFKMIESVGHGDLSFAVDGADNPNKIIDNVTDTVVIKGSRVHGLSLRGRKITHRLELLETNFDRCPDFRNTSITGTANFTEDLSKYGCEADISASSYRRIKQEMEQTRHRSAQGLFAALEQRSSRRYLPFWSFDRLVSWLYDKICWYGISAGKPMRYLAYVFFSCWGIYWLDFAEWHVVWLGPVNWEAFNAALLMSTKQTVAPFYSLRQDAGPQLIQVVHVLQSLLSIIFLALGLLAIRWRYRRG